MTLSEDYASRLRATADRVARLGIDRRDPHSFHETKDAVEQDLRTLANQVEIDQVFTAREAPATERAPFRTGPRTVIDRRGRPVAVETRRRPGCKRG